MDSAAHMIVHIAEVMGIAAVLVGVVVWAVHYILENSDADDEWW